MRKNGFTLTEVIITIAIVGVVAAMTIPTLITTHRKQVLATSLASAMADFQSSINNMIIKEGVNDLFGTQAWSALRNDDGEYVLNNSLNKEGTSLILNNFLMQIRKTLLVEGYDTNESEYNNIDNAALPEDLNNLKDSVNFKTKKGIEYRLFIDLIPQADQEVNELELSFNNTNHYYKAGELYIDVNGANAEPNVLGRDLFVFDIATDGKLVPYGSRDWCQRNNVSYVDERQSCVEDRNGATCTSYLINNEFKMEY